MKFKIKRKKYNVKGKLAWEYNALHNLEAVNEKGKKFLTDFDTDELTLDINHPVDIECQPSYDGSTNIIFNDDYNVPRIINSAFSLTEDNSYERVSRNQIVKTNIYRIENLDSETRLQRTTNGFLKFDITQMSSGGSLPGGNYIFMAQYSDDDGNKTTVVAESGIVSVFNGHYLKPETIVGTLAHEITDKQVQFNLLDVDTSFSKIYISYRRDYCDLNGVKQTEYKTIERPYEIRSNTLQLNISGIEKTIATSYDELSAKRNMYQKIKTHTQTQNMLFFGNVEENYDQIKLLQDLAMYIQVQPVWGDSVGWLDYKYVARGDMEYRNPMNIYNNVGYVPEEYYRLGVVFIYNDDSRSAVFNLRGCVFETMYQWNHTENAPIKGEYEIDINSVFINDTTKNTKGVFKMPYIDLYSTPAITPINLNFYVPPYVLNEIKKLNIKGYYFVRQKRIPIFLTQGFSLGVSENAHNPMISAATFNGTERTCKYRSDGPLERSSGWINIGAHKKAWTEGIKSKGLLCPDAILNSQIQSLFTGSRFVLKRVGDYQAVNLFDTNGEAYVQEKNKSTYLTRQFINDPDPVIEKELIYIPESVGVRTYKKSTFSTKIGSSTDVKSLRSLEDKTHFQISRMCVRGECTPFVGVVDSEESVNELTPNSVYNIYTTEYGTSKEVIQQAITKRAYNMAEYTALCDPISIKQNIEREDLVIARGDCFTCTSSHKILYNFLDHNTPLNTRIVSRSIWGIGDAYTDALTPSQWNEINTSDVNSVDFGYYATVKYMSNFNHNIRSVDTQHLEEISLFGSPRTFIPFGGDVIGIGFKIPDSKLHNSGLSVSTTFIPSFEAIQVPYVNNHFDNRIAFSNISSVSSFSNGYRVFSGISYQDIERTYGAIVKLLPVGSNLFCVFEHGCGIVPVNEKALLSTTTGQSIHLYGAGVLQEQVTVISQDYGSTWEDSIVVTPNGIYGVDTWAKKIWRYDGTTFSLISDQLVQRYLNENITLLESDWTPTVALKNVKSHYNAYKGDIMFTFYKDDVEWNLCFNERIGKFVTRYSWTPLLSENIQNSFVSIDKQSMEPLALIAKTQTTTKGVTLLNTVDSEYTFNYEKQLHTYNIIDVYDGDIYELDDNGNPKVDDNGQPIYATGVDASKVGVGTHIKEEVCKFNKILTLVGYDLCNGVLGHIRSVTYSKWDPETHKEIVETIVNDSNHGMWIDNHPVTKIVARDLTDNEIEELKKSGEIIDDESAGSTAIETDSKYKVSAVGWGLRTNVITDGDLKNKPDDVIIEGVEKTENYLKTDDNTYYKDVINDEDDKTDGGEFLDGDDIDRIEWTNFKASHRNYVSCTSDRNLGIEVKLSEYVNWIKINLSITPTITTLDEVGDDEENFRTSTCTTSADPFLQTICFITNSKYLDQVASDSEVDENIREEYKNYLESYKNTCRVGLYTHGKAGIYDEINYSDLNPDNQVKPTVWYNKQEPFEFEFVVNSPVGLQKVFDNLVIISNNVEPESLDISIVGDVYDFNKAGIFNAQHTEGVFDKETGIMDLSKLEKDKLKAEFKDTDRSQNFDITYNENTDSEIRFNTTVSRDNVLNQYVLNLHNNCRNVKDVKWGKRLGNIEYREDKWLVTLSPIMFKQTQAIYKDDEIIKTISKHVSSTKIRDKWCKIKIRYKGDKLVVISSIHTLMSLSFS